MRERDLEKILVQEVKKLKGQAYKWTSPGNNGVPDRIVFLPGHNPYFVELKAEDGRLTKLQQVQINRLRDLGQKGFVLFGMADLIQFFRMIGYCETAAELEKRHDF